MRPLAALVTTGALVLGALVVAPAEASRPREPHQVQRVQIVRASPHSLTLKWAPAKRAQRYLVERARGLDGHAQRWTRSLSHHSTTIKKLRKGALYCFWVRGVNRGRLGDRSHRACQYTIGAQGKNRGPRYDVMTWNVCAAKCGGWDRRRGAAARLIRTRGPSVLMLQEYPPGKGLEKRLGAYAVAEGKAAKALLYKKKRFKVAHRNGKRLTGEINLGYDPGGHMYRWAVWAELVDKRARGKHVIFVSTHLAPGADTKRMSKLRAKNARLMLRGIRRVNDRHVPVVIAGDFNHTQAGRWNGGAGMMKRGGYRNSFFYAQSWYRPNINSYTQKRGRPTWSNLWGRHLDQVWVRPGQVRVLRWSNVARIKNGRYPRPLVSDHNPVMVKLRVN
jgi:endonuclease/exonuclease/phosphatase family metal-dependent hydrolase